MVYYRHDPNIINIVMHINLKGSNKNNKWTMNSLRRWTIPRVKACVVAKKRKIDRKGTSSCSRVIDWLGYRITLLYTLW